ncbi:unnamed protein product [Polarella glacialis]|uniref:Tyrosine-protein kinase ephrin type A/B receptor-like domain-containing protein n=1 Tax=Polarella glacialis TaxID=89957 RepID=A0A813L356_POLGL|nr:unnamed protein product [Polarella glacialis]
MARRAGCCYKGAAASVAVLSCLACYVEVVLAGRPCQREDWSFAFGTCGQAGQRNVYAYSDCDEKAEGSMRRPDPLMNVSCSEQCPSGTKLGVEFVTKATNNNNSSLKLQCSNCPAGRFSLGGGLLVSGVDGDWHRAWPPGLQSSCDYRRSDGTWVAGGRTQGEVGTCQLAVQSPSSVAGRYTVLAVQDATGRPQRSQMPPLATLRMAPGNHQLCEPVPPQQAEANPLGGSVAPALQAPGSLVLLAVKGGCSAQVKAAFAAAAGARAVILAPAAAVATAEVGKTAAVAAAHVPSPAPASSTPRSLIGAPVYELQSPEDAQVFAAALGRAPTTGLVLNMTSLSSCRALGAAVAPPIAAAVAAPSGNSSGESSALEGCNPWKPDASGRSIHSGDNRLFDRIVSTLELSVNLVRDGFVLFRYSVDAEAEYDGFSFEVDWKEEVARVSVQRDFKDVRVNLTAGTHSLRWQYAKDYSGYEGADRAQLELIEVEGTSHADVECLACHSSHSHSAGGAEHCNACGSGEYLDDNSTAGGNMAKCKPCPAGRWAPAGSIGSASCMVRNQCTVDDVHVEFSPCRAMARHRAKRWRQPESCDTQAAAAQSLLQGGDQEEQCPPCEVHLWRPDSSNCVPQVVSCAAGSHAVTELVLSRWGDWPSNLTLEVTGMAGSEELEASVSGAWRLHEGSSVVAGFFGAPQGLHGLGVGLRALLHLDVEVLLSPGHLNFTVQVPSPTAWGSELSFLLDDVDSRDLPALRPEWLRGSSGDHLLQVSGPVSSGRHRLTWLCTQSEHAGTADIPGFAGARLLNVSILGAKGAGADRCAPCPPGHEVSSEGISCQSCSPGKFLGPAGAAAGLRGGQTAGESMCLPCPADTFSSDWASLACRPCGRGTVSGPGSSSCASQELLSASEGLTSTDLSEAAAEEPVVFNTTLAVDQWRLVTGGTPGPFLVSGRKFFISLLEPVAPPGDAEGPDAFVWERLSSSDCGSLGASGSSVAGGAASVASGAAPAPALLLGASVSAVQAVAVLEVRGIRVTWETQAPKAPCPEPASQPPQGLSGVSLLLRCDPSAPWPPAPARKDSSGNFHLPHLRIVRSAPNSSAVGCVLQLEWPSAAACPSCRMADYAPQVGACSTDDSDGGAFSSGVARLTGPTRPVTFVRVRPCLGGSPPPPEYAEVCEGGVGVTKVVPPKYAYHAEALIAGTILLGCLLCCYATCLHCKYKRMLDRDGGL